MCGSGGAAMQVWQPMGLHQWGGSQVGLAPMGWQLRGCAAVMVAKGAALQVRQQGGCAAAVAVMRAAPYVWQWWGCTTGVAADGAAPMGWQPSGAAPMGWQLRGCAAAVAAEGAALQVWRPTWLHPFDGGRRAALQLQQLGGLCCNSGSQGCTRGCTAAVVARGGCATSKATDGAALQVWQPVGLRCICGSLWCTAILAAKGAVLQIW